MNRGEAPAAVVDVHWGVVDILDAIEILADNALVVIRRDEGDQQYWYVMPADRMRYLLGGAPEDGDVRGLLDLHESTGVSHHDLGSGPVSDDFHGLATDSDGTALIFMSSKGVAGPEAASFSVRVPPRRLFPVIEAPHQVDLDESFLLEVGLSETQVRGVAGGPIYLSDETVVVEAQVSTADFELRAGESWRNPLHVVAGQPLPSFVLHLAPRAEGNFLLTVSFSVAGEVVGFGARGVRVGAATVVRVPPASRAGLSTDAGSEAVDLTVQVVARGSQTVWTFYSPHQGIDLPDAPIERTLGHEPRQFAQNLLLNVPTEDAGGDAYDYVLGSGDDVTGVMPSRFWKLLAQVAREADGRPPRLLLLTNDPYVPWELALMEEPFDEDAPPLLAAQAEMGRWVIDPDEPDSSPRPAGELTLEDLAVFWGRYEGSRWRSLPEAEEESKELERSFSAVRRPASRDELGQTLDGLKKKDKPHGIHFAGHGVFGDGGLRDGLVLGDGQLLKPPHVKSKRPFKGSPFVFLNACEIGAANSTLGVYGGMARAFLRAGAGAVVAPLWKVDDSVARDFARELYRRSLDADGPVSVAGALRSLRTRFRKGEPSTWVAYQFYGHPGLALKGRDR